MKSFLDTSNVSSEESDDSFHSAEGSRIANDSEVNSGSDNEENESNEYSDADHSDENIDKNTNSKMPTKNDAESVSERMSDNENNAESDSDVSGDESGSNSDSEKSDKEKEDGDETNYNNAGWADAMAKILKTNKPKKKKSLILSRAKKNTSVKLEKKTNPGFDIVDDNKEKVADILLKIEQDEDGEPKIKKRREELPDLRVKPNILEKGREKLLSKIATRGVVQLFNAVRQQQKDIEKKLGSVGKLERKKDKVIKSIDKHKFLDMLMGKSKSENVNKELIKNEIKKDVKEEDSTWSVFREDFLATGAKMKDWDKKDKETSEDKMSELSDSDSE